MPINFTETDTASACAVGAYCSPDSAATTTFTRQATDGGTPGVTAVFGKLPGDSTKHFAGNFECVVAAGVSWDAGTWVVRINITQAQANFTWEDSYICRVSSGCVNQATIASLLNQAISLATTGVKTMTIPGGLAQSPAVGDKVIVVLVWKNAGAMALTVNVLPDQNIDSPFIAGAAAAPPQRMLTGVGV